MEKEMEWDMKGEKVQEGRKKAKEQKKTTTMND